MTRWLSALAILIIVAGGWYWVSRDPVLVEGNAPAPAAALPIEHATGDAVTVAPQPTALEPTDEVTDSQVDTNEQLARAQFYRDESGKAKWNTDPSLTFTKLYEFEDGTVVRIPFAHAPASLDAIGVDPEAYSLHDFDELLESMIAGDWTVIAWAQQAVRLCKGENRIREADSFCSGYRSDMGDVVDDILWLLADAGEPRALGWRARRTRATEDDTSTQDYEAMWEQGYVWGLINSLNQYSDPYLLDYEARETFYAKGYVMMAIFDAYADGVPREMLSAGVQDMWRNFDLMFSDFGATARERAQKQAQELLAANKRCCLMPIPHDRGD